MGGGPNAAIHAPALREYLLARPDYALVFATARHAAEYSDLPNDHYYCIVGNEGRRLMGNLGDSAKNGICILPPYPREMGTEVPDAVASKTFELPAVDIVGKYKDSVTTIALQLAQGLTDGSVLMAGYDGYPGKVLSEKEMALTHENQTIFDSFVESTTRPLWSLTPTLYPKLGSTSVYQYL